MLSDHAQKAFEDAVQEMTGTASTEAVHALQKFIVHLIEDYHVVLEKGEEAKAAKMRRKLERVARRLRKREDVQATAERIREMLNERDAPGEWHQLTKQLFPDTE